MTSLRRHPDWQLRLESFIAQRQAQPFAWGANDCALFAAAAVQALTGADVAATWLGQHTSARAAWRAVRAAGGLPAIATAALGPSIGPAFARVGDLVLLPVRSGHALGLCNGVNVLGPGPQGIAALPRAQALACWRVG
jgi:hypothetical protein